MNTRNRFGVVALMALTLALYMGAAAVAADILLPPPDSPSPAASGTARTSYGTSISGQMPFGGPYGYYADTRFQVSGLRPNTTYRFSVVDEVSWSWWYLYEVSFTTNRRGNASGRIQWLSPSPGTAVYTVVDGADVVVLVGLEE